MIEDLVRRRGRVSELYDALSGSELPKDIVVATLSSNGTNPEAAEVIRRWLRKGTAITASRRRNAI